MGTHRAEIRKTVTRLATGLVIMLSWEMAAAGSYLGVGTWKSSYSGGEHDRSYESDTNYIRSVRFGWNEKELAGLFGDVNFDDENRIRDMALGLILEDYTIHVAQGRISGEIIDDESDSQIDDFDNEYLAIDLISRNVTDDGGIKASFGVGYREYAVPERFDIGDADDQYYPDDIQDDAVQVQLVGWGIYKDPIRNYLLGERQEDKNTWYFSTHGIYGLGKAVTSDAPDMVEYDVDGEEFHLFGAASSSYELGWFIGTGGDQWGLTANLGYHLEWAYPGFSSIGDSYEDPEEGEINEPDSTLKMHGPRAEVRMVF